MRQKERLIEVGVRALASGRAARTRRGSICVVIDVSLEVEGRGQREISCGERRPIGVGTVRYGGHLTLEEFDWRCAMWTLSCCLDVGLVVVEPIPPRNRLVKVTIETLNDSKTINFTTNSSMLILRGRESICIIQETAQASFTSQQLSVGNANPEECAKTRVNSLSGSLGQVPYLQNLAISKS